MTEKYRVHELAKDLNVQSKEILEVLDKKLPDTQRKYQTALSEKEINLALEHFTDKSKITNANEFLEASKNEKPAPKDKKPAAPKSDKPRADKPAASVKSDAPAAPAAAPAAASEQPKTDAPRNDRPQATYRNDRPQGDRPQATYRNDRPQGDRPQSTYRNDRPQGDRPQSTYRNDRPQGDRPQSTYRNDRPQGDRPQGDRPQSTYRNDRPQGDRPQGDRPQSTYRNDRPQGDRPQGGYNRPQGDRPQGDRPQGGYNRPQGDRPQGTYNRPQGDRPQGTYNRPQGDRPQGTYNRPQGDRPQGTYNRPQGDRPQGTYNRPQGDRPQGGYNRPQGDRPQGGYNRPPNRTGGFGGGFDKEDDRSDRRVEPKKKVLPANRPAYVPQYNADGTLIPLPTHVDTRAANVDLEKYNERYEKIATETKPTTKDFETKKQKFGQRPGRKPVKSRKEIEAEKLRRIEMEKQRRERLSITIPEEISVGELALKLKVQASEIIKRLMTMGTMASVSQVIDYDTAALVAMEIGAKVEREVVVTIEDRLFVPDEEQDDTNLTPRCPVVVVMGHVDHGKTSLLDAIRSANVTEGEAGGITQHIGAYQVMAKDRPITFLDTPGHAAFTSMRARGAQVTDIAVLVVAADDGIMPQTIEAINHAKAAGVSIIVAINKIDKPAANIEKVKQELTEHSLVPEEWGGDVICVPVSAKTREGIDDLLENILLVAEFAELKANPDRMAKGTVIEAKLDKGRGPVATILVQNGTLKIGDIVIAGTSLGRVRVMLNDKGERISEAGPSMPVEITGLSEVPSAGDIFNAVEDERLAKELAEQRRHEAKEEVFKAYQKVTLDNLFSQISEGDMKELPIIVKADVDGSVEAVKQSLEKLSNAEVRVRVIHGAVGAVSESDVMLANASNAIIVGFNVRPEVTAQEIAQRENVDVRLYRIIYDAIEEVASAMKGMLAPKFRDVELGRAEVRAVYKITNVGLVAGCYVLDGKITRHANIRIVREGIIVGDDKLDSLKRFKDDVKEVATGYECGMSLLKFKDVKEGDIFEAYIVEEYRD